MRTTPLVSAAFLMVLSLGRPVRYYKAAKKYMDKSFNSVMYVSMFQLKHECFRAGLYEFLTRNHEY